MSQVIDQVETINSVKKSSKSELSSGTFGHFKVWPLLVIGMNLIPRPLAIGMRFIPMDGGCLPHWDEALDESTGIIEAVHFAPYLFEGVRAPPNPGLSFRRGGLRSGRDGRVVGPPGKLGGYSVKKIFKIPIGIWQTAASWSVSWRVPVYSLLCVLEK